MAVGTGVGVGGVGVAVGTTVGVDVGSIGVGVLVGVGGSSEAHPATAHVITNRQAQVSAELTRKLNMVIRRIISQMIGVGRRRVVLE